MKKVGVFVVLFLLLFSIAPAFATEGDNCTSISDCDTGEICQNDLCTIETTSDTSTTSDTYSGAQQDPTKIEDGFDCLEEKAGDCSDLTNQEIALTILATPDNIFDDCVDELKSREKSDNWGSIKDTSLAILALKHAGENVEPSKDWLIAQSETPTDLIWYLEQDSNEE